MRAWVSDPFFSRLYIDLWASASFTRTPEKSAHSSGAIARCMGCPRRQSAWSKENSRSRTRILAVASGGGTMTMKSSFSARISLHFSSGIVSSGTTSSWYAHWVITLGPVHRKDKSPLNRFHRGSSSACPRFLFFGEFVVSGGSLRFSTKALLKIGSAKNVGWRPPYMSFTPKEAPCFKSFITIPICEFRKAMQRGVSPLKSAWSTAHPCPISQSAQISLPSRAAAKSACLVVVVQGINCQATFLKNLAKKFSRTFVERSASRSKHKTLPAFVHLPRNQQIEQSPKLSVWNLLEGK